ncbi:alpha/beta fold hydrolase [Kitasatospora purpeofusca]|uniref:alpha/beta fold hydrolase n=1 Tax=Kitasatospora purpeofusca TaxID=67352 RepID=UPI0022505FA7|nr:alpha/beta hydrolase [Kitasatospora purpeofusca]MCX4753278.1 alpha/beta hydrolase [Kitasatospora purpeofusca]WSR32792.1 alpha/beta hydrolase [Kitasatospora purpeofusca]WSR40883.1 alpha/beta hydrolase [Kitasatospora purpeofusca]
MSGPSDTAPVATLGRAARAVRAAEAATGVSRAGLIGISVGVLAAGAAAGVAIDRLTVGRSTRRRARAELDAEAPYGSLRGRPRTVAAADGTELYVELDGLDLPEEERDGTAEPLTVVFCHGYCLNQDSWHFQRAAFRSGARLVLWDQRSHGRSERSRSFLAGEPAGIDQLGGDLKAVIDAVAPTGPLVLVGHSMGGMTMMALADQHPELFRERVAGVALIGTLAGNWDAVTFGLPVAGAKLFRRVAPGMMKLLGRQVDLVEATRRLGADVSAVFYRRYSFGAKDVDPGVVRFAEQMLDATPIDVVAEFYPVFSAHEKTEALAALRGIPTLVLTGTKDLLTPPGHGEAMAEQLPGAELVLVQDAGHLVMLERPDLVDHHLADLLDRAARFRGAAPLPPQVGEPA